MVISPKATMCVPWRYPAFPFCNIAWLASVGMTLSHCMMASWWPCTISLPQIVYKMLHILVSLPGIRYSLCKTSWSQTFYLFLSSDSVTISLSGPCHRRTAGSSQMPTKIKGHLNHNLHLQLSHGHRGDFHCPAGEQRNGHVACRDGGTDTNNPKPLGWHKLLGTLKRHSCI